jgi:hypothetical protein
MSCSKPPPPPATATSIRISISISISNCCRSYLTHIFLHPHPPLRGLGREGLRINHPMMMMVTSPRLLLYRSIVAALRMSVRMRQQVLLEHHRLFLLVLIVEILRVVHPLRGSPRLRECRAGSERRYGLLLSSWNNATSADLPRYVRNLEI